MRGCKSGFRGIVAATGTGKTRLALEAIRRFEPDRVVIVVPTTVLQEQWASEVRRALHLPKSKIGKLGGQSPSFRLRTKSRSLLSTPHESALRGCCNTGIRKDLTCSSSLTSAIGQGRRRRPRSLQRNSLHAGSFCDAEHGDDGFEEIVVPSLGDVVFRYPLRAAVEDGVLSEIVSTHVLFGLTDLEKRTSEQLTARITALRHELNVTHPDLGTGRVGNSGCTGSRKLTPLPGCFNAYSMSEG